MLVKIPVVRGKIKVYSKNIERVNILTKLILHSISRGININRIPIIINLSNKLVLETIEELEKRGIIEGDYNGNYKLTEVGNKNFTLLNEIEKLNKKEIEVLVDSYTKYIFIKEDIAERYIEESEKIEKKAKELNRNKYMRQYLKNLDPSNSKDIVLKILDKLDEKEKEGISVEIEIIEEKGGYIVGEIKKDIVKKVEKSKFESEVVIKREIFKNTYTPIFNSLKSINKRSIDALEILIKNNSNFISDKGLEVLEKVRKSKENMVYYYDPKTKDISKEKISSELKESEIKNKTIIDSDNKEENIKKEKIESLKLLKEVYGEDIEFRVAVEKEAVYEKFAIEDVIDIYEEVVKNEEYF